MKKLFGLVVILGGLLSAQSSVLEQFSQGFANIAEKANPAVVTIKTEKTVKLDKLHSQMPFNNDFFQFFPQFPQEYNSNALGSGVIVDKKNGYILTNNHVVDQADKITVQLMDKREITAKIIGTDPKSDLAVLQIKESGLNELPLGNSDKIRVGELVLAVGSPFSSNLSHTVTAGIISAMGRSNIISNQNYEDFIQTDAAINPGNSGGALLNMKGELIGINTAIATGGYEKSNRGVGFAIPSNMAKKVMADLIDKGYVVRAWLGVLIQPIEPKVAEGLGLDILDGALVGDVVKDSPAEKAGLKEGDVIVGFEGTAVKDPSHLKNIVSSTKPGTRSGVEILRDGKPQTVYVVLEELEKENQELLAGGAVKDSNKLGLQVQNLTDALRQEFGLTGERGVVVTNLQPGSHAEKSGIKTGDLITRVGRVDIASVKEFQDQLKKSEKNKTVLLLVKRDGVSRFYALESSG